MSDTEDGFGPRGVSMNTRLSAARIFDEDSNESDTRSSSGKVKNSKKNVKNKKPSTVNLSKKNIQYETDVVVLERRQKQIDYGKNTVGYDNYRSQVPFKERTKDHPKTPVKYLKYSRRGWDGLIKVWRQQLHEYDPDGGKNDAKEETASNCSDLSAKNDVNAPKELTLSDFL